MRTLVLVLCALLLHAGGAAAARLEIPLRVSLDTLREALNAQLTGYKDGPCRRLSLKPAALESREGHLRLALPGNGALGVDLAGKCQTAATWEGTMHFTLAPRIDDSGRVRVSVVDSSASGMAPALSERGQAASSSTAGALQLRPRRLARRARRPARGAAPPVHAAAMELALQRLDVLAPKVEASHVLVPIAIDVPDAWLAAAPRPPPPLAPPRRSRKPSSKRWKRRSSPGMRSW